MTIAPSVADRAPTVESVLETLPQQRLLDLNRLFGCEVRDLGTAKDRLVRRLANELQGRLPDILRELGRDELRTACRRHGLADQSRARADLQGSLLQAAGIDPNAASLPPPRAQARLRSILPSVQSTCLSISVERLEGPI